MFPLPAILALEDTKAHIGTPHYSDNISNVKSSVDDFFGIVTVLVIPNVDSDNSHIQLGRDFDDVWSQCKNDVIENVITFENAFDIIRGDTYARFVNKIWNAYDFKVGL